MSSMDDLVTSMLEKKSKEAASSIEANAQAQSWVASVEALFSQMEIWWKPLVDNGLLRVERLQEQKQESPEPGVFMDYKIPRLILRFNRAVADLSSIGLLVADTNGRVCLAGDDKRFLISRSLQPSETWTIATYLKPMSNEPSLVEPLSEDALAKALSYYM